MRDKATRQCPQTTTFEEKGEPKRIRTELALTPYLPLRQTGSQLPTSSLPYCVARRAASLRAASASHCHFFFLKSGSSGIRCSLYGGAFLQPKTWSRSKANSADCRSELQPFTGAVCTTTLPILSLRGHRACVCACIHVAVCIEFRQICICRERVSA